MTDRKFGLDLDNHITGEPEYDLTERNEMNNEENTSMDATAAQAKAVVIAAIAWGWASESQMQDRLTRAEWVLVEALKCYGDKFKGLKAR